MRELNENEVKSVVGGLNLSRNGQSSNVRDRRNIGNESRWGNEGREDGPNDRAGANNGGSGASRVICTYFFKKNMLDQTTWRADMEFTYRYLSPATVRGYHVWAIPYVKLMRKSRLAERIMLPLAAWRAEELAYKMGVLERGSWRGKLVRVIGEPICWVIGTFSKEQNWEALWDQSKPAQAVEKSSIV